MFRFRKSNPRSRTPGTCPRLDRATLRVDRATLLVLLVATLAAGCGPDPAVDSATNSKPTFSERVAAIQRGESSVLHVDDEVISDDQLGQLSEAPGLETLRLDAGRITDRGLPSLAALPQLSELRLRQSPIGDAGAGQIANFPQLRILNVPHSSLTSAGVRQLNDLATLRSLRLGSSAADTDFGTAVAELTQLTHIHLIDVPLSESQLLAIAALPRLQSLYVDGSGLGDHVWEQVFAAHPGLHIHVDQSHHDRDPNRHD